MHLPTPTPTPAPALPATAAVSAAYAAKATPPPGGVPHPHLSGAGSWERALSAHWLGNRTGDWLEALGVTVLLLLLAAATAWVLRRRLRRMIEIGSRNEQIHELSLSLLRQTRWGLLMVPAVYLGTLVLELSPGARGVLRSLAILASLLQAALWTTAAIDVWVLRERRRRLQVDAAGATLLGSISFFLRLLLWVLVGVIALENMGVNVSALVTGLGVGGIAVALALQNILGDILASLSIAIDKPFVLGDTIQVDALVGKVEDVGLKTTRLRSPTGEQLIFANGDLLKSRIRNLARQQGRQLVLAFGLDGGTTPDQLEKVPALVRDAIAAQAALRFDRAHLKALGQGTFDFEAVYSISDPDYKVYMDAQQALLLALLRSFAAQGIHLAQPLSPVSGAR